MLKVIFSLGLCQVILLILTSFMDNFLMGSEEPNQRLDCQMTSDFSRVLNISFLQNVSHILNLRENQTINGSLETLIRTYESFLMVFVVKVFLLCNSKGFLLCNIRANNHV